MGLFSSSSSTSGPSGPSGPSSTRGAPPSRSSSSQIQASASTSQRTSAPPTRPSQPSSRTSQSSRSTLGRPQPRSLADLTPNSLYVVLFNRVVGDASQRSFHWAFYLHDSVDTGGWKMHITNSGLARGNWMTDHAITKGVFKSMLLVGLMRIRALSAEQVRNVQQIIREEDQMLSQIPELTCRIWLARACERLRQRGYLRYQSWNALEDELWEFGRRNWEDTDRNVQPRPLVDSRVSRP